MTPARTEWRGRASALLTASIVLVLLGGHAAAHDRTTSYSTWIIRGRQADVTLRFTQLEVTRFPWSVGPAAAVDRILADYVTRELRLHAGDTPCEIQQPPRQLRAAAGRLVLEWRLRCLDEGALSIHSGLFLDVAPAHLHFARVRLESGRTSERVLADMERSWVLLDAAAAATGQPAGTSLAGYVVLGVEHILTGYDHLVFLLALLLIGGSLGSIARVVTGFTVAHSITLGLTVLGYVRPDPAPVEALIGLSIALVAVENVWLDSARQRLVPWLFAATLAALALAAALGRGQVPALTLAGLALFSLCYFGLLERVTATGVLRWSVAFLFGFVHGFAFAAVLVEAALPTDRLVPALLGFNIGVELGQLAAVIAAWPLLHAARRRGEGWRRAVLHYGSAAVLALGISWFVSRAFP